MKERTLQKPLCCSFIGTHFQKTTDLFSATFQLYHIKEIIEYETFTNISFYLSVCACGHMCGCPQRPEEGGIFPGTVSYRQFRASWRGCWEDNQILWKNSEGS